MAARRFLVFQAFLVWQGGFVFYAGVVVPQGTRLHGAMGQGLVTQTVTDWLNVLGAVWAVILAWDILATPAFRRPRIGCWGICVVLLAVQTILHLAMDEHIRGGELHDPDGFRRLHIGYLCSSTVQWVSGLALAWWTLRAWESK